MVRLILVVAFVAVIAIAFFAVLATLQSAARTATGGDHDMMPAKFQRITYVLLIILMFGVTSGWLGGV